MKRWCFAVTIFGALVRFAAAAEPNGRAESLTIDLPTALRLAGARNIDIQLAREKLAQAHAEEESAIERFFPWIAPGVTYRRHDNLIQNTEGVIEEVHKQSYAPGGTVFAQTDVIAFKGDALRVKVQQQRDEIALRRAQENVRLASAKLVQILHLDPTVELMPRDASVVPLSIVSAKEPLGDLVSQALATRPETQQGAAFLSAAQHAKNGAIYGPLIPAVGGQAFFGGLGGGKDSETGRFGESEDYVALLNWRIGPGGLFDFGNIHAQQARVRGAALTTDKVIDQVANEVITNRTRVQSLADQIATAKQSLSDAAEALRLAQERKEFGVGVVLETILAQQELSRVRNDYVNIVADYNKTQYGLLRALGRLSTPTPALVSKPRSSSRFSPK